MEFYDLSGDIARQFQREQHEGIREAFEEPVRSTQDPNRNKLLTKIKFSWNPEDKNALLQIRASVSGMLDKVFGDTFTAIDRLYEQARVPDVNEHGVVRLDSEGRIMWKMDEYGRPLEDWSQIDGVDIEKTLMDLARIKLVTTQVTSELYSEALFAKHILDDQWYEQYDKPVQGTQGDRTAKANRETQQEKYHAFFRYLLWEKANTFQKEIQSLSRLLEKIREWRIWGERNN